ncbi:pentapeptide repeat-containing protein [Actinosynnema sp. CA-299493]
MGAIAVVAAAGELWSAFGALLASLVAVTTLVLLVGRDVVSRGLRIWISALAIVFGAGVVVGRLAGVDFLATPTGPPEPVDLRGKVVTADDVKNRDLRGALLAGAVFDGVDLRARDLTGALASGASFRGAVLDRASLVGADLRGADLRGTCMYRVDLTKAVLDGADATGANVADAVVDPAQTEKVVGWPTADAPRVPSCA